MNVNWRNLELPESFGAERNIPLSELTSFRVGGPARVVLHPRSYEAIAEIVSLAKQYGVPLALLGRGTNVLASDRGYDGWIIRFDTPLHEPVCHGTSVTVCCGTSMTSLARETVRKGLSGMECLCGIPGTVGGACAMNAGAYGGEIRQILKRIRILKDGRDEWIDVKDGDLGYRRSVFSFPDAIALEAAFELKEDDGTAAETMLRCMEKRKEKQPLDVPSAGSTFKRPEGYFAGALIEQCGLKGFSIGGAQVSPKHAGFIVNANRATEADISALIEHVRRVVKEQTGVTLEPEVKRI
ncbi:MAG: UDP-N-acetylmuramate dehydrogenase [Clostridia bacterium]|nr:UDP-N-acetylmuramate dehydrogenase [Clostridia bacterium]